MKRIYNRYGKNVLPYMAALNDFQKTFEVVQHKVAEIETKIHETCLQFKEMHNILHVNGSPAKTEREKVAINIANMYIDRLSVYVIQIEVQLSELDSFKSVDIKAPFMKNDPRMGARKLLDVYVSKKRFYLKQLTELIKNHREAWKMT